MPTMTTAKSRGDVNTERKALIDSIWHAMRPLNTWPSEGHARAGVMQGTKERRRISADASRQFERLIAWALNGWMDSKLWREGRAGWYKPMVKDTASTVTDRAHIKIKVNRNRWCACVASTLDMLYIAYVGFGCTENLLGLGGKALAAWEIPIAYGHSQGVAKLDFFDYILVNESLPPRVVQSNDI